MALRKNVRNLLPAELSKLREAHKKIMSRIDNQSYQHIAGRHGWPDGACEHAPFRDEMGRLHHLFLPWHRAYMYHFERYLQIGAGDDNIGLPWWNWHSQVSETEGIPKAYSDETANNEPNPLYKFRMNFRGRTRRGEDINIDRDTTRAVGETVSIRRIREVARLSESE